MSGSATRRSPPPAQRPPRGPPGARPELLERPVGPRDADDRPVEMAAPGHRLESREYLLRHDRALRPAREIAAGPLPPRGSGLSAHRTPRPASAHRPLANSRDHRAGVCTPVATRRRDGVGAAAISRAACPRGRAPASVGASVSGGPHPAPPPRVYTDAALTPAR